MADPDLSGLHILLAEDDFMIARSLRRVLEMWGATIVGPVATLASALTLVQEGERIDAAILDINLRQKMVFPVADALIARKVRFAFTTGYDTSIVPDRYREIPVLQKPFEPEDIVKALFPR